MLLAEPTFLQPSFALEDLILKTFNDLSQVLVADFDSNRRPENFRSYMMITCKANLSTWIAGSICLRSSMVLGGSEVAGSGPGQARDFKQNAIQVLQASRRTNVDIVIVPTCRCFQLDWPGLGTSCFRYGLPSGLGPVPRPGPALARVRNSNPLPKHRTLVKIQELESEARARSALMTPEELKIRCTLTAY
jgi:hypothetical protein